MPAVLMKAIQGTRASDGCPFFYLRSGGINMAEQHDRPETNLTELQLKKIREAVRDIRYGTVTLVIQDGRLIQIDRSEKIRLKSE